MGQAQVCGFFFFWAKEMKKCFQPFFFQKNKIKGNDAFSICQVFDH
jgi:hypothetical protein